MRLGWRGKRTVLFSLTGYTSVALAPAVGEYASS